MPRTENTGVGQHLVARRYLKRFVAAAVVGLILVAAASVVVAQNISRDIAVREAVAQGRTFARAGSAPLMHAGVSRGDPESVAAFAEVMVTRLEETSMVHIKVWDARGTILWSDQAGLRGRTFELEAEVMELFESGGAVGYITELERPENIAERGEGDLLEVYAAATTRSGERVIVESYWSAQLLEEHASAVMRQVAPLAVGALLLFALIVFPLAWSLARRVERVQGENGVLLQHALDASDLERRRIARDLHDGVMQDVTAVGYQLSVATTTMDRDRDRELPRRLLDEAAGRVLRIGEALRSTMADIYPTDLASLGLMSAVQELAARAQEEGGVTVGVTVVAMANESPEVTRLSYRVVREGLRNVVRHAQAAHAEVLVTREGDTIYLSVDDDGRGAGDHEAVEGHLGLQLLRDTMCDVGGALVVTPGPDGGTHFAVTFPRDLARG